MKRDMLDQILAGAARPTLSPPMGGLPKPTAETIPPSPQVESRDSTTRTTEHSPRTASEESSSGGLDYAGGGGLLDLNLRPYERLIDRSRMHPNNRDMPWVKRMEAMETELMEVLAELQPHLRECLKNDLNTQT